MGTVRDRVAGALVIVSAMVCAGVAVPVAQAQASTPAQEERLCPAAGPGIPTCFAERRTDVREPVAGTAARFGSPVSAGGPAPAGYSPADLRAAYALPASTSNATVAVVDAFDDPNAESDLAVYRSTFGLSPCTGTNGCFRKINQRGAAAPLPSPNAGWAGEISLDLDTVSAVCPSCRLLLVEADDERMADFGAAVDQAARAGAAVINNSYGDQEDGHEAEYDAFFDHPGIAVVASTGDDGYGTVYPASSPYVLAVGGTTLTRAANARGWTESAWRGGGAGCSRDEPPPSFQGDVSTGCRTRAVADVAAVADPATGIAGYDTFDENGWQVFGGTSVAAPLIAGVYGLVGGVTPGEQGNARPYRDPGALYDITTGDDGPCADPALCAAAPGYDQPTGLGTPHGVAAFAPPGG